MNAGEDYETKIFAKVDLPEVLRQELARPTWRGEKVAIGTATDPYQPVEGQLRLRRRALEVLREFRDPLSIVTKSTLIIRDPDLLADLARRACVRVYLTVTTLEPTLWRQIEPGAPPPEKRLAVLARLAAAGVPCGVMLAPLLPGITDSAASIEAVVAAASAHGAISLHVEVLRLAPLVKEHYFAFLQREHPELLTRCARAYPGSSAPAAYARMIEARVEAIRARSGFGERDRGQDRLDAVPDGSALGVSQGVVQLRLAM
ncbi:MAG: radical SAM protein [Chloroflexota bacterium]